MCVHVEVKGVCACGGEGCAHTHTDTHLCLVTSS